MKIQKKKVVLFAVLFLCVLFLVTPEMTSAAGLQSVKDAFSNANPFNAILGAIKTAVSWILYYAIFVPVTWIASAAIALFSVAINADLLSGPNGLLNRAEIYELWKFVRDFCNIFFIFMLLIGAFSMVFQLDRYNAKKTLLSIILVALFVNFSFPLSRVLIDVSNVPTYFFAQQILQQNGGSSVSDVAGKSFLSASQMTKLLLPTKENGEADYGQSLTRLIVAIIFMFLFAVSLCILAILFVIRVVALVILVIFSPIGFMKFVPGLDSYANDWWKKLTEYLIFAPVAMFMLLVSIRFANVIGTYDTKFTFAASGVSADAAVTEVLSQMMMSAIPIILIMMTISVALSAKVSGTESAKKLHGKMMAWGKRGGFYNNAATRGFIGGRVARLEKGKYTKYLTSKGRADASRDTEERWKGLGKGGFSGYRGVNENIQNRKIYATAKENRENNVNHSALLSALRGSDPVKAAAAAITLAENKADLTPAQLQQAVTALGTLGKNAPGEIKKLIANAQSGSLNLTPAQMKSLLGSEAFAKRDDNGKAVQNADGSYVVDPDLFRSFAGKMKSAGKLDLMVDYNVQVKTEEARQANGGIPLTAAALQTIKGNAIRETLQDLSASDWAKQSDLMKNLNNNPEIKSYVQNFVNRNTKNYQNIMDQMSDADQQNFARYIQPPSPPRPPSTPSNPATP